MVVTDDRGLINYIGGLEDTISNMFLMDAVHLVSIMGAS